MSETFTNEGLTQLLNFVPRATGSLPTTLYLAALTTVGVQIMSGAALDATHVPAPATVWATDYQTTSTVGHGSGGEPTIATGSYARVAMSSAVWGAPAVQGSAGVRSAASQQSFPQSTAAWSNQTVIGTAVVTSASAGGGIAYAFANFDDNTSVVVNASGIVLQVTPYWQINY